MKHTATKTKWYLSMVIPFFLLLILTGCSTGPSEEETKILEETPMNVVQSPEEVVLYRILPGMGREEEEKASKIEGELLERFPIVAKKKTSSATVSPLRTFLFESSPYTPHKFGCAFVPHHAVQFQKGDEVVDVVICLECDDVEIYHNGDRTFQSFFDRSREEELEETVKSVFSRAGL